MLVVFVSAFAGMLPALSFAGEIRCTCRYRDGSNFELGQTVCIRIGDVSYLARCEMALNNTTWRKIRDGCPEARLSVGELNHTK